MDCGKYEFIKNFIEQKAKASLVNSDEASLFKNKDNVSAYITHLEFLIMDGILKDGNEFWRSHTNIYRWLNSGAIVNSKSSRELYIGVKMNSRNISLEFFSIGYRGCDLNSKVYKKLWVKLNSFYGRSKGVRVFCKTEFENTGWVEFSGVPYAESNPFLYDNEF
jgi:hypothetical protein